MALFASVVAASKLVSETSSRSRKIAILAELLRELGASEVPIAVALLSGAPRQGRVGVGYSTVHSLTLGAADEPSLSVGDVDRAIAEIQVAVGRGSATRRRQLLAELMGRATEQEADFLRRLFTGELRQGALAGLMADAVAKAAELPGDVARRALMLSGDLPRTAEIALSEGEEGLSRVGFEIFRPILPMLASTSSSVGDAMSGFELSSVEWKLDGIRIQIHRRDQEVRIYTRNLNEITGALPGIVAAVLKLPVRQAVLDGEALWMSVNGPAAFQETVSQIDRDAPPQGIVTFLFDLLHIDGEDLLDSPLFERAARLERLAPQLKIPSAFISDPEEAQRVLDESLSAGHEGVVVKDASSLYAAGRRGKAWRKVKPVRTYDLVVLGAEWGHGRRRGWLSNLHLGALDPRTGGFVMVGKTFKGLTDELLDWQTRELLERETDRRGIAVLARPELVVEIALDGVQSSTRYPGGIALRFARVKRYRVDKDPAEADTIDDLRALLPGVARPSRGSSLVSRAERASSRKPGPGDERKRSQPRQKKRPATRSRNTSTSSRSRAKPASGAARPSSALSSSTCVLVLGMHRSGTSVVSRGLNALGVYLGDSLLGPQPDNPKGYWEHPRILAVNEEVMAALDRPWQSSHPISPEAWTSGHLDKLKERAASMLVDVFGGQRLWGFKDPRTIRVLPFWLDVLAKEGLSVSIVLSIRRPQSAVSSLATREGMSAADAERLWLAYMLPVLPDIAAYPVVVVDYDRLIRSPLRQLRRIANHLGVTINPANPEITEYTKRFVERDLRHHVHPVETGPGDGGAPTLADQTYAALLRLTRAGSSWRRCLELSQRYRSENPPAPSTQQSAPGAPNPAR